ncbi:hypothetical protein ACRRTK_000828 [Alexandromys fortis]
MKLTFPSSLADGFWSVGNGYLSLFKGFGYKLLLVMVRKKTEQRRLDSGFLF